MSDRIILNFSFAIVLKTIECFTWQRFNTNGIDLYLKILKIVFHEHQKSDNMVKSWKLYRNKKRKNNNHTVLKSVKSRFSMPQFIILFFFFCQNHNDTLNKTFFSHSTSWAERGIPVPTRRLQNKRDCDAGTSISVPFAFASIKYVRTKQKKKKGPHSCA